MAQIPFETDFKEASVTTEYGEIPFRVLTPQAVESDSTFPLVLFLHGAGQRGDDNRSQLQIGVWNFARPEIREAYPAFVIAPQAAPDDRWSQILWWEDTDQRLSEEANTLMLQVKALLDHALENYPVDPERVYVTGLSMGGFGTWEFVQRWPDMVAAMVPVCGGGDLSKAVNLKDIPVWVFHGTLDNVVKPEFSRMMIDELHALGNKAGYTEYPDVQHDAWVRAYSDPHMIDWLFRQKKGS
jgi:predicted peptidase